MFIDTAQVQCEPEVTRKAQIQLTTRIPLCLIRDPGGELTVLIHSLQEFVLKQGDASQRTQVSGLGTWNTFVL